MHRIDIGQSSLLSNGVCVGSAPAPTAFLDRIEPMHVLQLEDGGVTWICRCRYCISLHTRRCLEWRQDASGRAFEFRSALQRRGHADDEHVRYRAKRCDARVLCSECTSDTLSFLHEAKAIRAVFHLW